MPSDVSEAHKEAKTWDSASKTYDADVALSSGKATPRLVEMAHALSSLDDAQARAIDLGAGTGSLTLALAKQYPDLSIMATDFSPSMLESLRARSLGEIPSANNITTEVLDMTDPITESTRDIMFSHVFSTMAIQCLAHPEDPKTGVLHKWLELLQPGGVMAIGLWDFDEPCGPWDIFTMSTQAVDPNYTESSPRQPKGAWRGYTDLENGMRAVGLEDIKMEKVSIGFNVGTEGFMHFAWEGGNPMPAQARANFGGDLDKVKQQMRRTLQDEYEDGWNIPLYAALAVGKKPK